MKFNLKMKTIKKMKKMKKMKTNLILIVFLFSGINTFAQKDFKEFAVNLNVNQQYVKSDFGLNIEGVLNYRFAKDFSLGISFANAKMENDEFNLKYNLQRYGLQTNYAFAKVDNFQIESIFGFSYLMFDEELGLEDSKGLGIDVGIQAVFRTHRDFNYGLRIVTTYAEFSPGGIMNAGAFFRLNL